MFNKCKKILFTAVFLLCLIGSMSISVSAADGQCGERLTWNLSSDGTLTISGSGDMWDYALSTTMSWHSRLYQDKIKKLVINYGVTSIGKYAFYSCDNLKEVSLPDSLKSIGVQGFGACYSLPSITIPAGVSSIDMTTFHDCTSLQSINVSSSNPYYSSLGGILYTKSGTKLIRCPSAKTDVNIPSTVTIIDDYAFYQNSVLKFIYIPEGVKQIASYAFAWCPKLEAVSLPSSLQLLGAYSFAYCQNLKTVTIPASVSNSTGYAFCGSNALESAVFLAGKTEIDEAMFYGCKGLKTVYIPFSVKEVKTSAFSECTALAEIFYGGTVYSWGNIIFGSFNLPWVEQAKLNTGLELIDLSKALVEVSPSVYTYDGAAKKPSVTVTFNGTKLVEGFHYVLTYVNNVNPGTATAVISGKRANAGVVRAFFTISGSSSSNSKNTSGSSSSNSNNGSGSSVSKKANPMTVKSTTKAVKYSKVKKKAQKVKPLKVSNAQGTVSYKITGGNKKSKKALKINSGTGAITVKKGTKKGIYKVRVTIAASGNGSYNSGQSTVNVTVRVK